MFQNDIPTDTQRHNTHNSSNYLLLDIFLIKTDDGFRDLVRGDAPAVFELTSPIIKNSKFLVSIAVFQVSQNPNEVSAHHE